MCQPIQASKQGNHNLMMSIFGKGWTFSAYASSPRGYIMYSVWPLSKCMQPSRTWKALLAGISANIQAEFATPTQQIIDPPQRKIPAGKRGQGWAKFVLSEPCRRDYPQKKPISAVPIAQENLKDCEILVDKHMQKAFMKFYAHKDDIVEPTYELLHQ